MTTAEKVARRKLSLLDLAGELANVSKACKVMGYSRQQFYEIRRNFQTYGSAGFLTACLAPEGRIQTGLTKRSSWLFWIAVFQACSWATTSCSRVVPQRCPG